MVTFKPISNPERGTFLGSNKRKAPRYAISPTFPLKAAISFGARDVKVTAATQLGGARVSTGSSSSVKPKEWPGSLIDLSATGANVHLSLAAVAFPEDPCRIIFTLGTYQLEIPATVAHYRCSSQFAMCGVLFEFPDVETEKAYFQLLEPVIIGTSLAPAEAGPDASGRHREIYRGKPTDFLTVWRQAPDGPITSFDFRMNRHGVRWSAGLPELITYGLEDEKAAASQAARPALKLKLKTPEKKDEGVPTIPLGEAEDEEVRWLFCLAISNLSDAVAEDVRKFLLSLVVA